MDFWCDVASVSKDKIYLWANHKNNSKWKKENTDSINKLVP